MRPTLREVPYPARRQTGDLAVAEPELGENLARVSARLIAASGMLDLDDVGAERGKDLRARRTGS
jgi:hypothetical protein